MTDKEDKAAIAGMIVIIVVWLVSVLLSLAGVGVAIWGVIELVQWVTSQ